MEYFKAKTFEMDSFSLAHWPISVFMHSLIIMVGVWISLSFNKVLLEKKARFAVIKTSIRVDIVAMPKLTKKELKSRSLAPPIRKKVKPVSEVRPKVAKKIPVEIDPYDKVFFKEKKKSKEKKKRDFLSLLKSIGKRKIKDSSKKIRPRSKAIKRKKTKDLNNKVRKELKQLAIAGNILSKGTSIVGDEAAKDPELFEKYALEVRDIVKENWKLPSYLSNKGYKCKIRIFISKNGNLLKTEIYESSQVSDFNKKALGAIYESSPFPEVPESIQKRIIKGDLYLAFPL